MKSIEERIAVKTIPVPECGCLIWEGYTQSGGYGVVEVAGRKCYVHRLIWEIYNGPIPEGMEVCHHCDTPSCENHHHLFLGTHKDNMIDAAKKNRMGSKTKPIGVINSNAKLTEEQVIKIRNDYKSYKKISQEYGIGKSQVARIKHRQSWSHVCQ
jgi:hypothetical protein